jgi:cytochrome c biogenesis protein CcdA
LAHLLAIVIGVGLADSLNPSTIAPALYLATGRDHARSLAGFIAGVFFVNFGLGVLLALGPGRVVMDHVPHPTDHAKHLIEISAGSFLLVVAAALWIKRSSIARHVTNTDRLQRSSLYLGAGIALVEFPTALPYFAAIAAVVGSGERLLTQVVLLAIFNLCFVVPLLAIFGLRTFAGERTQGLLTRARTRVDGWLATLVPGIVAVIGVALIAIGVWGIYTDRT